MLIKYWLSAPLPDADVIGPDGVKSLVLFLSKFVGVFATNSLFLQFGENGVVLQAPVCWSSQAVCPLNETVQGLVMDVLWVTHPSLALLTTSISPIIKILLTFCKRRGVNLWLQNNLFFTWGSWANTQGFEEPHYCQAALLQWRERFGKLPIFLKEKVLWRGHPFYFWG